jgi:DNA-binding NarL/FixJ family response regulator
MLQLNSVIVDSDPIYRQEMTDYLSGYGVDVVAQVADVESLPGLLGRSNPPQLIIINIEPHGPQLLRRIGHLPRQYPQVSFFVLSKTVDASLLMEAMQLGIREFIPLPIIEGNFSAALDRLGQQHGMGDHRWLRFNHRRLQRRRRTGEDRLKDRPDRYGSGPRWGGQLLRYPPALHYRRCDGIQ